MAGRTDRSRLSDYGPEVYHPHGGLEVPQKYAFSKNMAEAQDANAAAAQRLQHPQRRNPFSLNPFAFGLLVGLLVAVVVGAASVGGLGASLVSCRRSNSASTNALLAVQNSTVTHSTTTTATPTSSSTLGTLLSNYAPAATSAVDSVALNCPALNNQATLTHFGDKFTSYCGLDFSDGLPADGGGVISDIVIIVAYSAADCMEACSALNYQSNKWGNSAKCLAISFNVGLKNSSDIWGGNCVLKNATLAVGAQANSESVMLSAKLQ